MYCVRDLVCLYVFALYNVFVYGYTTLSLTFKFRYKALFYTILLIHSCIRVWKSVAQNVYKSIWARCKLKFSVCCPIWKATLKQPHCYALALRYPCIVGDSGTCVCVHEQWVKRVTETCAPKMNDNNGNRIDFCLYNQYVSNVFGCCRSFQRACFSGPSNALFVYSYTYTRCRMYAYSESSVLLLNRTKLYYRTATA